MRINPVLRNESKLSVRTPKFTIMLLIYIGILAAGVLLFYNSYLESAYVSGIDLQSSVGLYAGMAIGQAVLLMFIVPALTSTAICSEREKQTLDMLLSSKLTPIQIIIGKMSASSIKVIMLIVSTIPIYAVCALVGGVRLINIIQLVLFFIVCTIFVGSIGVFISTYMKTSKTATAVTYGIVLLVFIGPLIFSYIVFRMAMMKYMGGTTPEVSWIINLSPAIGFFNMIANQVGMNNSFGIGLDQSGISKYAEYISIAIQLSTSAILIYLSAIKLNPLNRNNRFKFIKRKKIIKE